MPPPKRKVNSMKKKVKKKTKFFSRDDKLTCHLPIGDRLHCQGIFSAAIMPKPCMDSNLKF